MRRKWIKLQGTFSATWGQVEGRALSQQSWEIASDSIQTVFKSPSAILLRIAVDLLDLLLRDSHCRACLVETCLKRSQQALKTTLTTHSSHQRFGFARAKLDLEYSTHRFLLISLQRRLRRSHLLPRVPAPSPASAGDAIARQSAPRKAVIPATSVNPKSNPYRVGFPPVFCRSSNDFIFEL